MGLVARGPLPSPFPFVVDTVTGFGEANATSTAITLPSAGRDGDLDLAFFASDGTTALSTASAGWTEVQDFNIFSSVGRFGVYAGVRNVAAALTVTSGSVHRAWVVHTIRNWNGVIADIAGANAASVSGTPDPPSLTPAAGTQDYLWIVASSSDGADWATASPSGWSALTSVRCSATAGGAHTNVATAYLAERNSVKDPGTFTSTFVNWGAMTIAVVGIRPVAARVAPSLQAVKRASLF